MYDYVIHQNVKDFKFQVLRHGKTKRHGKSEILRIKKKTENSKQGKIVSVTE